MYQTIQTVGRFIEQQGLLQKDEKVLVALSGGADSVFLLLALKMLGYPCLAAHCNFHLRGAESLRDERFVRELCTRNDVKLHVTHFDTEAYAKEKRQSIELAARNLRYGFFKELMQAEGCQALAVGHHKDDNVETFLLNAVRKTGVRGLCGIKPVNVNEQGSKVVRPLLCVEKKEIEDCLRSMGEAWVTDSTNLTEEASRNKIRLSVVPVLKSINMAAVDNLCDTMRNLNEVMRIYEAEMERCKNVCAKWERDTLIINREKLATCVSPISVLHELLSPLGFNETQIQNLLTAKGYRANRPKGGREIKLPKDGGTVLVEVSWKQIKIEKVVSGNA